jgi:hypothetical protein
VLGADLDQELPVSPRRLGERRDLRGGAGGRGGEHDRDHREQPALGRRLASADLLLERQQPLQGGPAGKSADHASGGGLELEP